MSQNFYAEINLHLTRQAATRRQTPGLNRCAESPVNGAGMEAVLDRSQTASLRNPLPLLSRLVWEVRLNVQPPATPRPPTCWSPEKPCRNAAAFWLSFSWSCCSPPSRRGGSPPDPQNERARKSTSLKPS